MLIISSDNSRRLEVIWEVKLQNNLKDLIGVLAGKIMLTIPGNTLGPWS